MKGERYTEEQIVFALRQAESGIPAVEVCRKMGVSEKMFYNWKCIFAGLSAQNFSAGERLAVWLDETRETLRHLAAYAEVERAKEMFVDGNDQKAAELAWRSYQRVDGMVDLEVWGTSEGDRFEDSFELYYNLIRASPATFGPLVEQRLKQGAQIFDTDDRPTLGRDAVEACMILRDHYDLVPKAEVPPEPVAPPNPAGQRNFSPHTENAYS